MEGLDQPNVTPTDRVQFTPRMFALAAGCGLLTGLAAGLLMKTLRLVQTLAFGWNPEMSFEQAVARSAPQRRVACLLFAALIVAVAVWLKRGRRVGDAGVTKAVWLQSGFMPLRATFVEALESIAIVGLGVSLGREAALKEAGGALASWVSSSLRLKNAERKVLVAIAAGAGMAAAYNLPLGGALLAAEVFLGTLSLPVLLLALTASGVGTLVSWTMLPVQTTYTTPAYPFHGRDVLWAALTGPVFGVLSWVWIGAVAWARAHRPRRNWRYLMPLLSFGALGVTAMWFPDLLGNGKGLVQLSFIGQAPFRLLLVLLALKFVFTAACIVTGAPGGLFTPTMSLGALSGGVLGRLWALLLPRSDVGAYALIGSAAMLAVSTAGPISALVMVMELTHHAEQLMVPVVIATAEAALVAKLLAGSRGGQSIYTV